MDIDKLTEQILEITNNSDYGWIDLDSADADRVRVALTQAMNYIPCCKSDSELLKDRKIKDLLNWVKSDLKQETNNKLSKTATPYRTDKIRFLNKLLELQNL